MPIALMSWNVHGWVGDDRRRDPARAFRVILGLDADVVALQEADGSDWESLANAAGYTALLGRTRPREFGNAVLVRAPVATLRRLDLSVPGREPRGALDAVVSTACGPLRVVATHLGLRAAERRRQIARLARHLGERDAHLPVALLGDLNDWTPWGSQLRPLVRRVGPLSRIPTFPSRRPILPLDRAAVRAPRMATRVASIRSPDVVSTSDHLPLRVEIRPASSDEA